MRAVLSSRSIEPWRYARSSDAQLVPPRCRLSLGEPRSKYRCTSCSASSSGRFGSRGRRPRPSRGLDARSHGGSEHLSFGCAVTYVCSHSQFKVRRRSITSFSSPRPERCLQWACVDRLGYVPALDGLRAVAITLVVTSHAFGWPAGGWLGVDLFFVLSGFLITTLLLERRGRDSIGNFYRRRGLRLLPALVILLGVALAVDRSFFGTFAGLGYISNLVMAGGGEQLPASFTHLWSLAAEEQFYIVWPFVLFAAIKLGARVAFTVAAAGAIASTALAFLLFVDGASGYRLFTRPTPAARRSWSAAPSHWRCRSAR
jgi:acyltransferase-like protein